jgi:hypothetical protein
VQEHPSGWYALDIFAGGGLNISATTGAEIPASALIALEAGPPLTRMVVLCERSPRALPALIHRVTPYSDRARVFAEDANAEIADMLAVIPRDVPALLFWTQRAQSWPGTPFRRSPGTSPSHTGRSSS